MDRQQIPRWTHLFSLVLATALAGACQPASQGDPPQTEDDTVSTGQAPKVVPNAPEPADDALLATLIAGDQSRP